MKKLFLLTIISAAAINASDSGVAASNLSILQKMAQNKKSVLPGKLYFRCAPVTPLNDVKVLIGSFKNPSYNKGSSGSSAVCEVFFIPDLDSLSLENAARLEVSKASSLPIQLQFRYKGKGYKIDCSSKAPDYTYNAEFNLHGSTDCYVSQVSDKSTDLQSAAIDVFTKVGPTTFTYGDNAYIIKCPAPLPGQSIPTEYAAKFDNPNCIEKVGCATTCYVVLVSKN
ncbi:hypothetical protein A3F66_03195 [candidate division TM6 bacterium RIFCSPHIGHO2_12_FULL_32_22]|nr:MAG: hypothetical protein A3F66_03195 [candidate division TM6 bacterium RIFCSPHIGHO2_12_FULL_32_22]